MRKSAEPELLGAIAEFQGGSVNVLSKIIELSQSRLFRFCLHLTGSVQAAEELCQDSFARMGTALGRLNDPGAFYAWIFKIAKNHFLNQQRTSEAKIARNRLEVGAEQGSVESLEALCDATEEPLETLVAVRDAVQKLPELDRIVLLLVDHEDYSYEEAGKIVGVSAASVRSRLWRARKAFVEAMELEK